MHIKNLLYAVRSISNLPLDLKLSIVLYLKNMLKAKIESREINSQYVLEILKDYVDLILTGNLTDKLLQNVNISLTNILNSNTISNNINIANELCLSLKNYTFTKDIDITAFKPVIALFQILISCKSTNSENILDTVLIMVEVLEFIISKINEKFGTINIRLETQLFLERYFKILIFSLEIHKFIFDFLFLSLLKFKKLDLVDKIYQHYTTKFIPYSVNMVSFTIPEVMPNLICWTGDKEFDSIMNSMKGKALQFISFLVQMEGTTIKDTFLVENVSQIVNLAINNLNLILVTKLPYISEMSTDNINHPDHSYGFLLYHIFLFFSRFLTREPIISHFKTLVKK